jgi:hypothetical protein
MIARIGGSLVPLTLRYPIYIIANRDGVVAMNISSKDCILLFPARSLAEEQIKKIRLSRPQLGPLHALPVFSVEALREGLESLPKDVSCAIWDPTGRPSGFVHVAVGEVLRLAGGS